MGNIFGFVSQRLAEYRELELKLSMVSGYDLYELLELFAKGYTLTPPTYDTTLTELAEELGT